MFKALANLVSKRPLGSALAAVLAVAAPVTAVSIAAPASAAQGDLDKVVSALRSINTMTADFTQTDRRGRVMAGKMTLKRPGKIRFQYEPSVPLLIVSNGKSLTMVDYEVKQVQRWPIKNSPLGALLDPKRDVKRYGKLIPTKSSNVLSVQVRDPKKPEYGVITMIFVKNPSAPGGLQLTSWVALDAQNNRTRVRLRNQRYGMSVSDRTFTYKDPRRSGRK